MLLPVVLVLASALAPPAPPEAAEARKLAADGAKLLKAKKLEAACQKYDQAARLLPGDAALLADLGACLLALGLPEEALEVTQRSLAGASEVRTRKGAYATLDGVDHKLELPSPGHCASLTAGDGAPLLFACAWEWSDYRSEEGASGTAVRLAVSQELAREGIEAAERPLPLEQVEDERAGAKTGFADLLLYENTENSCRCAEEDKACRKRCPPPETTTCRLVHVVLPGVGYVCRTVSEGKTRVRVAEVQVAPDDAPGLRAKAELPAAPAASRWAPAPPPPTRAPLFPERIEAAEFDELPPLDGASPSGGAGQPTR